MNPICRCHDCMKARLMSRVRADLERKFNPVFTPPHLHVYQSLFGVQHEHFGVLECWCGKPLIYQVPEASNARV